MKAIVFRELKDRRLSLMAYCLVVLALLVVYVALFPSVKESMDQFQKLYESYPKGLYEALGIENLSINTLENYLAIEMYSIVWQIIALLLSASLAGHMIAGQIEKGTIGFYLALPVSRVKLYVSKYLSGLIAILIFVLVSVGSVIPLAALFNTPVSSSNTLSLGILSFLFAWVALAISIFLSSIFSERGKVYMTIGGLLIAMYSMNIVAGLKPSLEWIENYSLFHYYSSQAVLSQGSVDTTSIVVYASLIVVFTMLGLLTFRRRDISV